MTGEHGSSHIVRASEARSGEWDVDLAPGGTLAYTGLRVATLTPGGAVSADTGREEMLLLPLEGSFEIEADGARHALRGRGGVFDGPTDSLYVSRDTRIVIRSAEGGRIALPSALGERRRPPQYVPAGATPTSVRGAGIMSRRVSDLGEGVFDADRLLVCEVITPGGNWSSYPSHKHDVDSDTESALEEIYYFEIEERPGGSGFGIQRLASSDEREIELLAEFHSGDTILVPFGWHGPVLAAPGHALYQLNAMAGPNRRAWKVTDDPGQAWVRELWPDLPVDERLL